MALVLLLIFPLLLLLLSVLHLLLCRVPVMQPRLAMLQQQELLLLLLLLPLTSTPNLLWPRLQKYFLPRVGLRRCTCELLLWLQLLPLTPLLFLLPPLVLLQHLLAVMTLSE